ncbi:MAG: hypothetical protein AB1643_02330 [Patescibacteria group bacterium]
MLKYQKKGVEKMDKIRTLLVRFRIGGLGAPTIEEVSSSLRIHGFPKQLDQEIEKIFRKFRNSDVLSYTIQDAEHDLLFLLRDWQMKKKTRKNVSPIVS